jgi:hypothetical protein
VCGVLLSTSLLSTFKIPYFFVGIDIEDVSKDTTLEYFEEFFQDMYIDMYGFPKKPDYFVCKLEFKTKEFTEFTIQQF